MKSYILLENLVLYAHHGVSPQETIVGNEYVISLKIAVDLGEACRTDDLAYTINYADVYDLVKNEMKIPSKLIEHAANRIILHLKREYPQIQGVELKLAKRNPPMGAQLDYASVILVDGTL